MEINLLTLVGIGLAAMFFGYFFGLFEGRRQGQRKRTADEIEERPAPSAPAVPTPAPRIDQRQGLLELGLVDSGRPFLRIDGREVDKLSISAGQRRRLIDLMVMLKPWVGPVGPEASLPQTPAVSKAASVDRVKVAAVRPGRPGAEITAPTVVPPATPVAAPQLSLVAQIDSILQARLAGTPLAERAIRLAESLHGGAIVFVGSTQYDGVDKVTDPEVQSAIRAAIAEWEKTATPG